jgi:DNA-binding NarL/FixJ family response regulator
MPELNGMEAAKRIRKISEKTEILILSAHYSDQIIRDVIDNGIRGYLVKADTGRDLSKALENLSIRRPFYSSYVTDVISNPPRPDAAAGKNKPSTRVTSRESEIIQTLSEGKSSKEVAVLLNISVKTVETHRANIMRKLELHTVSELVRYAIRNQIIEA